MPFDFRIQVPATSANLGVGFDRLGIALKFYNYFEAKTAETLTVKLASATCVETHEMDLTPENNLLAQSYQAYFKHFNLPFIPAELTIEAHIPFSRGLGSSSTAIVGGVYLANLMAGSPKTKDELTSLVTQLEGHPDNVVPALLGGLLDCGNNTISSLSWPEDWGLVFVIPPAPLSTKKARSVLPKQYSDKDLETAERNIRVWLEAVKNENAQQLKQILMADVLHEPYRKTLIPEYETVKGLIQDTQALGVVISGAGSTLLIITPEQSSLSETKTLLKTSSHLSHCKVIHLQVDNAGTKEVKH